MNSPTHSYSTKLGKAWCGDSLELLERQPDNSINLVMTSPPFALQRKRNTATKTRMNIWIGLRSSEKRFTGNCAITAVLFLTLAAHIKRGFPREASTIFVFQSDFVMKSVSSSRKIFIGTTPQNCLRLLSG